MCTSSWPRKVLSLLLVLIFSWAALGGDTPGLPAAVLHASGKVQVNGVNSHETTALFAGDSIRTDEDSVANITAGGSSVLVMPGASVKFLGNAVEVTEGGVSISTAEAMSAKAGGVTVSPVAHKVSKFEIAETEDSVVVAARQGDVTVTDGQQTSTVQQGENKTVKKRRAAGAAEPGTASGHGISGKTLAIIGGASGAAVAGILIATSKPKEKCVSPSSDKKCK